MACATWQSGSIQTQDHIAPRTVTTYYNGYSESSEGQNGSNLLMEICSSFSNPSLTSNKNKDPRDWNSILRHHTHKKDDHAILATYTQMQALGIQPDKSTLPLILKACARLRAIGKGKKIHFDIQQTDLMSNVRIQTALLDFYSKCGYTERAYQLFVEISVRDLVSWNAMISGYVGNAQYEEAILMFMEMERANLKPNAVTAVALLLACGELLRLKFGKAIHCYCLKNGFLYSNAHVGTALIGFYSKFDVRLSSIVFNLMDVKSIVSWNAMIQGYCNNGDSLKTFELFEQMLVSGLTFDSVTMLAVIQACTENGLLKLGIQIHQLAIKFQLHTNLFVGNALLNMYSKNGSLESSCKLFESISNPDVAFWNSMISAYIEFGYIVEATTLFSRMQLEGIEREKKSIAIMLSICAELESGLRQGKTLHAHVLRSEIKLDVSLGNAFLNMYSDLNSVDDALKFFREMNGSDVISWNTLILALARNKLRGQALTFFMEMREKKVTPNSHTLVALLSAFEDATCLNMGRAIHGYALKHNLNIDFSLNTSLVDMYMNCGKEAMARTLFDRLPERDLISWNALMASYIKHNKPSEALLLFHRMISEVEPNSVTIITALSACTHLAHLPLGRCLHAHATRRELFLDYDLSLGNALLTMYARCGSMQNAEGIFNFMRRKDIISWNAMIDGYGMHGHGHHAMMTFTQMLGEGIRPNGVTFLSLLSACSHSGMVEKGLSIFNSMTKDFNINPELVHYACVVDLLGRRGYLNKASEFINSMPIKPDASVWRALLSGCRVYSKTEIAKIAFEKIVEIEPENVGNYVLLSNIYSAAGLWEEARKLRLQLKQKGLRKPPGNSRIVVRNQVHCFTAGCRSHPQSDKIYAKLNHLVSSFKENGYVPDFRWVLHEGDDEDTKLQRLLSHSEKLAIAFGLINVSGGAPILVTKNLRVCGDCHEFSKHVSKHTGKEIVLRDGSRFHHFVNGVCSCKDYW